MTRLDSGHERASALGRQFLLQMNSVKEGREGVEVAGVVVVLELLHSFSLWCVFVLCCVKNGRRGFRYLHSMCN